MPASPLYCDCGHGDSDGDGPGVCHVERFDEHGGKVSLIATTTAPTDGKLAAARRVNAVFSIKIGTDAAVDVTLPRSSAADNIGVAENDVEKLVDKNNVADLHDGAGTYRKVSQLLGAQRAQLHRATTRSASRSISRACSGGGGACRFQPRSLAAGASDHDSKLALSADGHLQ